MRQAQHIKAGLFGLPLSKSLSPGLFGIFSGLAGVKMTYEPREVEPDKLDAAVIEAETAGWSGFNVTIPYKARACRLLKLADPAVTACGSVNAVRFGRTGLEGMNTDARALLQALGESGIEAAGKSAVVFGSGGAAASSGWALGRSRAASVTFLARNPAAAEAAARRLSEAFPHTVFSAAPFAAPDGRPDILVNATPLGMYQPGRPPCEFRAGALCADLAYTAQGTEFAAAAAAAGAKVIDGLSLLVRQAALSLRFWAGLPTGDIIDFSREAERLFREKLKG